jgi:hypothetical protein
MILTYVIFYDVDAPINENEGHQIHDAARKKDVKNSHVVQERFFNTQTLKSV